MITGISKAQFREQAMVHRDRIIHREEQSARIRNRFLDSGWCLRADTVFMYLSCRSEVETQELVGMLQALGKRTAVPKVEGTKLQFYLIGSLADTAAGYRGILEPVRGCTPIYPGDGDCILVPGVAFDRQGYRMGYGKGFYDRFLAGVPVSCAKIGFAFEEQLYPRIPHESCDMRMTVIMTQEGIRYEDYTADGWQNERKILAAGDGGVCETPAGLCKSGDH